LQPFNLRLEPSNVIGQGLDLPLPLVGLWLTRESEPPESIFKEPEEGAWPTQVGLIDLPMHGIG
jgi:hypothetical protein